VGQSAILSILKPTNNFVADYLIDLDLPDEGTLCTL
jgi:hypothetical protein